MTVDNFELIKPLFYFSEGNNIFFHCQLIRRAKDGGLGVSNKLIKSYFIRSRNHLEELREEIKLLCNHYGARAYINVSGKDFSTVNKIMLSELASLNCDEVLYEIDPRRVLNSAAGLAKSREPRWIVDIDNVYSEESIIEWFNDRNIKIRAKIPTVSGVHLIVSKFNREEFSKSFPGVDIHKNSMGTLLYYSDSTDSTSLEEV